MANLALLVCKNLWTGVYWSEKVGSHVTFSFLLIIWLLIETVDDNSITLTVCKCMCLSLLK